MKEYDISGLDEEWVKVHIKQDWQWMIMAETGYNYLDIYFALFSFFHICLNFLWLNLKQNKKSFCLDYNPNSLF